MCHGANRRFAWNIIALAAGAAAVHASVASDLYEVVALPHLGGELDGLIGGVLCVTDSGRAIGAAHDTEGNLRGLVWDRTAGAWELTLLPSLGDGTREIAYAGNAIGSVFGISMHSDEINFHATEWVETESGWTATDLGTLGGVQSGVYGMNAGSLIAGGARDADNLFHAVLWRDGVMEDIASVPGVHIIARDVNNIGQVVGGGYWAPEAFLWLAEPAYGMDAGYHALPTLGGDYYDAAEAINDSGLICGFCFGPDDVGHPVIWRNGVLIDLAPGSTQVGWAEAAALNERNQVVGYFRTPENVEHAFLWEDDVLTDLNDRLIAGSGWTVSIAAAINEAGWIGGYGKVDSGPYEPILLLPTCPSATGDVNGDGVVDVADLLILLSNWG